MAIVFLIALAYAGVVLTRPASAATQTTRDIWYEVGISGQVITNPASAAFLTVPVDAQHAHFAIWGGDLCIATGTIAPTATNSARWFAGSERIITNDPPMLKRMRVINCDNGDPATVQVYYSRRHRTGDSQ